jgi:Zinc knuckle
MNENNKGNTKIENSVRKLMKKRIGDITEGDIQDCGEKGKAIRNLSIKLSQDKDAIRILREKENEIKSLKEQKKKNRRICYKCREKGHYSKECKIKSKKD